MMSTVPHHRHSWAITSGPDIQRKGPKNRQRKRQRGPRDTMSHDKKRTCVVMQYPNNSWRLEFSNRYAERKYISEFQRFELKKLLNNWSFSDYRANYGQGE